MKISTFFLLVLFSIFSLSSFSQSTSKLELGTPETVLNGISKHTTKIPSTYALTLNTGEDVDINIQNYFNENGAFSMNGVAQKSSNSLFILKGDLSSLYGYLVLHDSKTAFEITTSNGLVSIEEINIAKIYPDLYESEITPPIQDGLSSRILPVYSPMALRQAVHIGKYNNEDITKLESKPGGEYVFYLDNSDVMNGNVPKNGRTPEEVFRMWQCVADQYSMLNLNVTTDPAVYAAAKAKNVLRTGNIHFVDADGRSNACVACFGTTAAGTLYRNPGNGDYGYGIGMTCAHEMGHEMGMSHDGGSAQADPEYFFGLPAVEWCPIMGNYWKGATWQNQLFTWSKGEYNTATQKQDDLKIMNTNENVPYVADDIPFTKALKLGSTGAISPLDNWGQIGKNTDSDAFTFDVAAGGGTLNLKIDPLEYLRQLDVAVKIIDSKAAVVASSNLPKNRSAEFSNLALPAGSYTLVIEGGAELTPQTGFSNYSSLGFYGMEGTLNGAVTSTGETTLEHSITTFPNPTEDRLHINYSSNYKSAQMMLTTVTGEKVFASDGLVKSIDMSDLSKGIYLLKIIVDGESCVKKVSKL